MTDSRAYVPVLAAVVVGVSLVGFLAGTARSDYDFELPVAPHAPLAAGEVREAPRWAELRRTPRGEGSGWETDLAALAAAGPQLLDPVDRGEGTPADVVAERASLRAYDGAPPQIPHPVRQDSAAECLACHEEGLRLRGRLAPAMSHRELTSCTQCHVVAEAPMPGIGAVPPDPREVPNTFVGKASPVAGPRAWAIAPPQVPHRTWMRERCESCHGVNGRAPIRSTHPHRESCEQCHAASAEIDLRPGL